MVVSYRNSTSNHNSNPNCSGRLPCCILSKFYIKPQRCRDQRRNRWVVSYRNSTSNHNRVCGYSSGRRVVSYRNSTSNHNGGARRTVEIGLYLIEILHQTTTPCPTLLHCHPLYLIEILHQTTTPEARPPVSPSLYLIEILHQTTTPQTLICRIVRCILSKFYIKPQPGQPSRVIMLVVSYRNSTSNHNSAFVIRSDTRVVSYRNSTSNHNSSALFPILLTLYLIEILHQTTTESL